MRRWCAHSWSRPNTAHAFHGELIDPPANAGGTDKSFQSALVLLRLNAQREAANTNLLIRLHDCLLFARNLASGNKRWVSSFWEQPVTSLIVKGKRCVHATDLRIAFEWKINGHSARAATDGDFRFSKLDDCLA